MTSSRVPIVAVTAGEPAGIGPELCAMLAAHQRARPYAARLVLMGEHAMLEARARRIGIDARYSAFDPANHPASKSSIEVWDQPLAAPVVPGELDPANAAGIVATLERACDACATGAFDAMVTAPVQKSVLIEAGFPFTGHTEFLAERTHTPRVVMMLVGGSPEQPLRVALVTTHLPLADVPGAITRQAVHETLAIVDSELRRRFGVARPRIAVCGLNPHAGESGHLGREDLDVIAPVISAIRAEGIDATGPMPADTVFVPVIAARFDAIVAMYHDQGLPVLKAASFGGGVNVTLGLPFVRTSVDHGTALDLAVDPQRAAKADPGSLFAAIECAIAMAHHR